MYLGWPGKASSFSVQRGGMGRGQQCEGRTGSILGKGIAKLQGIKKDPTMNHGRLIDCLMRFYYLFIYFLAIVLHRHSLGLPSRNC